MLGREPLQRTASQQNVAFPDGPETDVDRPEPAEVQRVGTPHRGFRPRAGNMGVNEIDHARIAEVAFNNLHDGSLWFS